MLDFLHISALSLLSYSNRLSNTAIASLLKALDAHPIKRLDLDWRAARISHHHRHASRIKPYQFISHFSSPYYLQRLTRCFDDASLVQYKSNPLILGNMDDDNHQSKGKQRYTGPPSPLPDTKLPLEATEQPEPFPDLPDHKRAGNSLQPRVISSIRRFIRSPSDLSTPPFVLSLNETPDKRQASSSRQPLHTLAQSRHSIQPPDHPPEPSISSHTPSQTSNPATAPPITSSFTPTEQAVQQAQTEIEVDLSDTESDPGYNTDSMGSSSTSLSSSVRNYIIENGRRYHRFREGAYNFPNDDTEQDREDLKHAMVVNLCGGRLHFAPLQNPQNILDMGTGTGIWAIEMGDLYPSANILGVDLSPIQPDWVPPGVQFMLDDVEFPWLRPIDHYDYIHARHTVMAIKDWLRLMLRVLDHLKPGGWFELQEVHHRPQSHDDSLPPSHQTVQFWDLTTQALSNLGVDLNLTIYLADMMRAAGFINVETRIFHIPIGVWPKNPVLKRLGMYWRTILLDGASPIALGPYTRGLRWSREQVDGWLVEVRKAYMDPWVHAHMPLYIICGQKPG